MSKDKVTLLLELTVKYVQGLLLDDGEVRFSYIECVRSSLYLSCQHARASEPRLVSLNDRRISQRERERKRERKTTKALLSIYVNMYIYLIS